MPSAFNDSKQPARETWQQLVKVAGEWFNKRIESRSALDERIKQFRAGCEALLETDYCFTRAPDEAQIPGSQLQHGRRVPNLPLLRRNRQRILSVACAALEMRCICDASLRANWQH
jgi:hypothetical protein